MTLRAERVSARYADGPPVFDGVTLEVRLGETVGLAGPSGSGKSTLARVLALLHAPSGGHVVIDGERVERFRLAAPARLRTRVGLLFQAPRPAVNPGWTLARIVAEPLVLAGTERAARASRVRELAEQVELDAGLLSRRPHQVSEGQLQRACLARALALDPGYLICDEFTAMLDASSTAGLVAAVRAWQRRTGAGVLAVSHDATLLDRWADRISPLPPPADHFCAPNPVAPWGERDQPK